MGQLTELDPVRKKRRAKKILRRIIIITILFTSLTVVAILWKEVENLDVKTKVTDLYAAAGSGPGYPISTQGGAVKNMFKVSNQIGILDDTNFYIYNQNAKQVNNIAHGYNNPVVKTDGEKTLLYDRGGNRLRVDGKTKNYFSKTYDHSIIYADISPNGNLAVATGSNEFVGQIIVYNSNMEEIFKWSSSENLILNIALSQSKDMMSVGCIDTVNGELTSYVLIFKFSSQDEVARVTMPGETILSLEFKNNNKIYAVTDKGLSKISQNGTVDLKIDFEENPIYAFANNTDKNMAVVLGDFKEDRKLVVYSLNENLDVIGEKIFNSVINSIEIDNVGIVVSLEDSIICYNFKMEETDNIAAEDVKSIGATEKSIYYATSAEINKVPANRPLENKKHSSQDSNPSSEAESSTSQSSDTGSKAESKTSQSSGVGEISQSSSQNATIDTELSPVSKNAQT